MIVIKNKPVVHTFALYRFLYRSQTLRFYKNCFDRQDVKDVTFIFAILDHLKT